jgi:hypothetical protein
MVDRFDAIRHSVKSIWPPYALQILDIMENLRNRSAEEWLSLNYQFKYTFIEL